MVCNDVIVYMELFIFERMKLYFEVMRNLT